MSKSFRLFLCAAALCLSFCAARAQVALYANFEANNLTQTNTWLPGGTFGLYDDFTGLGPIKIGADLRGSTLASGSNSMVKVLGGFRVAAKPPILPIKPYIQISAGAGKLDAGSLKGSYHLGYEVNGGVDLTFFPHLDWRVAEVGGGSFQGQPGSDFHIATGLVLRFF